MRNEMLEELRSALTVSIPVAGQALGFERTYAYQLARANAFPVPVKRVGSRYKVPTAPLLRYLGIEPAESEHDVHTPHPTSNGEAGTRRAISAVLDFTDVPPAPTYMLNRRGRVKTIYPDEMYRVDDQKVSGAEIIARGYIHGDA